MTTPRSVESYSSVAAAPTNTGSGKVNAYSLVLAAALNGVLMQGCDSCNNKQVATVSTTTANDSTPSSAQTDNCPGLERLCDNQCVDIQKDPKNCGKCGNACEGVQSECWAGICACPYPLTLCGQDVCVDTNTDPENCGGCGNECSTGEPCVDGNCQAKK